MSFLLYWLGLFLSIRFYKTKAERKREQDYKDKCVELKIVNQEIHGFKKQITTIQSETAVKKAEALAKYEYALATECELITFAKQAAEVYKSKNRRFRSDGTIPEIFSTIPQFQFKTFFDKVKSKQDEMH